VLQSLVVQYVSVKLNSQSALTSHIKFLASTIKYGMITTIASNPMLGE
jgi:hypothetical protein